MIVTVLIAILNLVLYFTGSSVAPLNLFSAGFCIGIATAQLIDRLVRAHYERR